MTVHREIAGIEYWYDPHTRCWFAAAVDAEGNLGPSVDAYTKREIKQLIAAGHCPPVGSGPR